MTLCNLFLKASLSPPTRIFIRLSTFFQALAIQMVHKQHIEKYSSIVVYKSKDFTILGQPQTEGNFKISSYSAKTPKIQQK